MAKRQQPNVLLISTDHWPAYLLGIAGHKEIITPTLDELARCGTRFSNAYSQCPVCIPARRTLHTGLTPRTHGDRMYKEKLEMREVPMMAQCFRDAGYQAYAATLERLTRLLIPELYGRMRLGSSTANCGDWRLSRSSPPETGRFRRSVEATGRQRRSSTSRKLSGTRQPRNKTASMADANNALREETCDGMEDKNTRCIAP